MPERDKAVLRISADIIGAKVFDGLTQTPRGVKRELWEALQALVDMAYVKVVQTLDWNRILLTASARHVELVDRDGGHSTDIMFGIDDDDPVCPDCIVWALLSETTSGGPSSAYRHEDSLADVKLPADWWHAWLYGEDGDRDPAESLRILFPLMTEAVEALEIVNPDDEEEA